jgi:hypothetical protein
MIIETIYLPPDGTAREVLDAQLGEKADLLIEHCAMQFPIRFTMVNSRGQRLFSVLAFNDGHGEEEQDCECDIDQWMEAGGAKLLVEDKGGKTAVVRLLSKAVQ